MYSREIAIKVTHRADRAAFIETAAHSAYFTEVMKAMRDKAKRADNKAKDTCPSSIFPGR
jgi:hypothetical protein